MYFKLNMTCLIILIYNISALKDIIYNIWRLYTIVSERTEKMENSRKIKQREINTLNNRVIIDKFVDYDKCHNGYWKTLLNVYSMIYICQMQIVELLEYEKI